ncbi:EamA family transporter RarD [Candidatus Liberibacter sp.]|uniref:EamA family transporter RarD n=1 Tax=Candidatus Liberibacter sp. TaxID=34022 RepID=UPI0015F59A28|nr:EamA family transporter RarD [Candidatus Liberibacter sp.]MBA5724018.1 EamA family transporter RarD [Candidatus Liberibacter sp.]
MDKKNSLNSNISKQSTFFSGNHGFFLSFLSQIWWGFSPLYLRLIKDVNAIEIIAQRVLWTLPIMMLSVSLFEGLHVVRSALTKPQVLLRLIINAGILSIHWFLFIYASISGKSLEASFGMFMCPLISILIGAILLKDPLSPSQILPIGLIAIAIAIMFIRIGNLPWLSLGIAGTWVVYSFCRKTIPAGPNSGFLLEMIVLTIPAIFITFGLEKVTGEKIYFLTSISHTMLLLGYGLSSGLGFCIFSYAIKITRLSYIGIMGYISPTIMFINTAFLLKQSVSPEETIVFILVICASVIYAIPAYLDARKKESDEDTSLKKS